MARARRARLRTHKEIVTGRIYPLFTGFSGDLSYEPDIIPIYLDFRRLIRDVSVRPEEMFRLTPRQFEQLIAEIWGQLGYNIELTAQTKDGGTDIIAIRRGEATVRYLIECKRYDARHKVGVEIVRALYGVKLHEKATKGILATTSTFTRGAKVLFAEHVWELEPRDFNGVLDWVKMVAK